MLATTLLIVDLRADLAPALAGTLVGIEYT
jgi:hypothetical protein